MLSDPETDSEDQLEAMVRRFVEEGRAEVIVTSLGAAGAWLAWGQQSKRLRAPTVSIQSKVGAGDSLVGGIVAGLVREYSIEDAVRFGVAVGAAAVMTPGTELCRKEDAERLYRRMEGE